MSTWLHDIRYALRGIAKTPLLSMAVLLALSAGIGLNVAVFTILDVLWLQAPVETNPGSFVQAIPSYSGWFDTEDQFHGFTVKDYGAIRARAESLSEVAAYGGAGGVKLDNDLAESRLGLVTCNFFDVYGWKPVRGRMFLPQECLTPGSAPVVVITESLWQNRFAADPRIVSRIIRINQHPFTVVGVINPRVPDWMRDDLWVPYTMQPQFYGGYDGFTQHPDYPWLSVFGRLNPGYSHSDAQAELRLIENQQDRQVPGRKTTLEVTNGSVIQNPQARSLGLIVIPMIMGPMALILLVACTNVVMLLLSRANARRSEMAIRLALGAGSGQLLRMLATEGLIIAAAAGAVSACLAYKLPGILWTFLLRQSTYQVLEPDWKVFTYLAGVALLAGCIAGLAPARESLKVDLLARLKGQEGTATARSRTRSILVIAQIAMSFVLVAAGVLFARVQRSITSTNPGFETRQVFAVPLQVSMPPYTPQSAANFYRTVRERVRELPGVRSASYTDTHPFAEPPKKEIRLPEDAKGQGRRAVVEQVSTDFFATLGIPIVCGRAFRDSDASSNGSVAVAVVSQTFAKDSWNEGNPLGKTALLPSNTRLTVVGVARDVKSSDFDVPNGARIYLPQNPGAFTGSLLVRFDGEARAIAPLIARTIRDLDDSQLVSLQTLWSMREESAAQMRPLTEIILMMACLAFFLALSGVYGTVAFSMSQRTREFGIRMALGATQGRIHRSVLVSGTRQIAVGLLFGILLALPSAFAFRQLGAGNSTLFDWSTYCVAALALTGAALLACYIPARRATRVDPMVALRYE